MAKKAASTAVTLAPLTMVDTLPELDDAFNLRKIGSQDPTPDDYWLVERLAAHFLTQDEICSILDISRARFEGDLNYQESYQRGFSVGKASLRRMQFQSAKRNPVMQIWLGKQHLDQHDKVETKQGDDRKDAYEGFLNKLQIELNISTTGRSDPKVIGEGKGDRQVLLGDVGSDEPTGADAGRMVEQGVDADVDARVDRAPAQRRKSVLGLVEDVALSGGTGKRKNTKRSGVGPQKS